MKVEDLFKQLSHGELRNLSMANEGNGTIRTSDIPALTDYTNDGLTSLYTRFCLRERDLLIEQKIHITNYHLLSRFSASNPDREPTDYGYIIDLPNDPYMDDAIKILAVFDQNGRERPLNDSEHLMSFFTPYPTVLQIPAPVGGEPIGVHYQAKHPVLEYGVLTSTIDLPAVLQPALKSYVAHKVYLHMNTQENSAKAQEHFASYEAICVQVEGKDAANMSSSTTNTNFERNGWV